MHPLGTYLAITDQQREHGPRGRSAVFAPVDAEPIVATERASRLASLAASLRRRMPRIAAVVTAGSRAGK